MSILIGMSETGTAGSPDATREAILAAAVLLFVEKGYDATTVDDVALAAGFTKGAVYWHFGSKEDLLVEVFEAWMSQGVSNLRTALRSEGAGERAAALDSWHVGDARRSRQWVRFELELLRLAADKPELAARLRDRQASVRRLLASALREDVGEPAPGGLSAEDLAILLQALSDGLLQHHLLDADTRGLFGRGVELLLEAATARPEDERE